MDDIYIENFQERKNQAINFSIQMVENDIGPFLKGKVFEGEYARKLLNKAFIYSISHLLTSQNDIDNDWVESPSKDVSYKGMKLIDELFNNLIDDTTEFIFKEKSKTFYNKRIQMDSNDLKGIIHLNINTFFNEKKYWKKFIDIKNKHMEPSILCFKCRKVYIPHSENYCSTCSG